MKFNTYSSYKSGVFMTTLVADFVRHQEGKITTNCHKQSDFTLAVHNKKILCDYNLLMQFIHVCKTLLILQPRLFSYGWQ